MDDNIMLLSEFGMEERVELFKVMAAWEKDGLPIDFFDSGVVPIFHKELGCVCLMNSVGLKLRLKDDKLRTWNECFFCPHIGFEEDCLLNGDGCNECHPIKKLTNKLHFKNVLIRTPISLLEQVDNLLREKPWMNRTQWLMEAIESKLDRGV